MSAGGCRYGHLDSRLGADAQGVDDLLEAAGGVAATPAVLTLVAEAVEELRARRRPRNDGIENAMSVFHCCVMGCGHESIFPVRAPKIVLQQPQPKALATAIPTMTGGDAGHAGATGGNGGILKAMDKYLQHHQC